jgi:hypothetical protein
VQQSPEEALAEELAVKSREERAVVVALAVAVSTEQKTTEETEKVLEAARRQAAEAASTRLELQDEIRNSKKALTNAKKDWTGWMVEVHKEMDELRKSESRGQPRDNGRSRSRGGKRSRSRGGKRSRSRHRSRARGKASDRSRRKERDRAHAPGKSRSRSRGKARDRSRARDESDAASRTRVVLIGPYVRGFSTDVRDRVRRRVRGVMEREVRYTALEYFNVDQVLRASVVLRFEDAAAAREFEDRAPKHMGVRLERDFYRRGRNRRLEKRRQEYEQRWPWRGERDARVNRPMVRPKPQSPAREPLPSAGGWDFQTFQQPAWGRGGVGREPGPGAARRGGQAECRGSQETKTGEESAAAAGADGARGRWRGGESVCGDGERQGDDGGERVPRAEAASTAVPA